MYFLNKVNLCWVLSDGRIGHEIQSLSLAKEIGTDVKLHTFTLKKPWKSITPWRLPFFEQAIQWQNAQPNLDTTPNIIITCGKTAAAVGKHYADTTKAQHIQILNPQDNSQNYDLLIIPEHDRYSASNVITTQGSLHNLNSDTLQQYAQQPHPVLDAIATPVVAVFLGNLGKPFFATFEAQCRELASNFSEYSLFLCGSPRMPAGIQQHVRSYAQSNGFKLWLNSQDGDNPYQKLLAMAHHFVVTADSINMVSEACATDKPVSVLGLEHVSHKHQRFVHSLGERISPPGRGLDKLYQPLQTLQTTLKHPLMTALIEKSNC